MPYESIWYDFHILIFWPPMILFDHKHGRGLIFFLRKMLILMRSSQSTLKIYQIGKRDQALKKCTSRTALPALRTTRAYASVKQADHGRAHRRGVPDHLSTVEGESAFPKLSFFFGSIYITTDEDKSKLPFSKMKYGTPPMTWVAYKCCFALTVVSISSRYFCSGLYL